MAERKAVNKYYPPDWDPRKGSVNKRVGQHPLRDRAKKLSQGILVIRFELPYNIWCGGCGIHVGMGVRYNAEKSKVGNYYSTPIYKFRMKCHLCDNYFEIQTDPKNHDYVILNGARRKEQRWDPVANGQIMPEDKATQKKLATDPMYKLEHGSDDHQKGKEQVSSLAELEEGRISMIDDYLLNRMARDKFRSEKKQLREAAEADKAILEKASLDIDLVEESEEDKRIAGLLKYSVTTSFEDKQKERRKSIEQRPIFSDSKKLSTSSASSSSSTLLSQPLPYQRHARPKLSKRGEIKQKLGWAIKASYKDPFKTMSNSRETASSSSPASTMQRQLGIKLKPAGQSESLIHSKASVTEIKPTVPDKDEPVTSTPKRDGEYSLKMTEPDNVSPTSVSLSDCDFHNDSEKGSAADNKNPNSTSNLSLSDTESAFIAPVVPNELNSSTKRFAGGRTTIESYSEEGAECFSNDTGQKDESNESISHSCDDSNSGLQALMSSYRDSDSDSTE